MRPGPYSWLVVIGGCLISMAVSVGVSVRMSDAALQRDQQQRLIQQQESRKASCELIQKMNQAYADLRSQSAAARDIAEAWSELAALCGRQGE